MQAVFADTSFWFALASHKDLNHHRAKASLLALGSRPLLLSNAVFSETVTLFRARRGHAEAAVWGNGILRSGQVQLICLTEGDEQEAWRIFCRYSDHKFSFADCSSFALMGRLGIREALEYDGDFAWMGFRAPPI